MLAQKISLYILVDLGVGWQFTTPPVMAIGWYLNLKKMVNKSSYTLGPFMSVSFRDIPDEYLELALNTSCVRAR